MTLTDSPPIGLATADGSAEADAAAGVPERSSVLVERPLLGPVMTTQSAVIGRLFIGAALVAAFGATVVGALVNFGRTEAVEPADLFGGYNGYFRMWSLYRLSLVLLVVMPLLLGVALVVVPRMIGAGGVAFPRAALASFWVWLIGAIIIVVSVLSGGGWGALDGVTANERDAIALTLLGTALVIVALLIGAMVIATTVVSLRETASSLLDTAPFAWSMLVTSTVWLLTLPVAVANIVLIYADLRGRAPIAYGDPQGADIWLQLDWLTEQPAVYAMAIPVLGIAIELVAATLGSKLRRPEAAMILIGLFGLLAVGGWSQDYFTAPQDYRDGLVYVAFGLAAAAVVAASFGALAELFQHGDRALPKLLSVEMVGCGAALKLLGAATLVGALRVIEPFELLEGPATSAVFNGVAVAGLVAAVAALWAWAPRLLGCELPRLLGTAAVALLFAGGMLLVVGDLISGFLVDAPDLSVPENLMALATGSDGNALLNIAVFLGSVLVVAGVGAVLSGVVSGLRVTRAAAASGGSR